MDLWLKGHSGDPLRVDRKGRPPEHIPRPALTLGLMIQPPCWAPSPPTSSSGPRPARPLPLLPPAVQGGPPQDRGHPDGSGGREALRAHARATWCGHGGWGGDPAVLILTEAAQREFRRIGRRWSPRWRRRRAVHAGGLGREVRRCGGPHRRNPAPGRARCRQGPAKAVSAQTILAAKRFGEYFKARDQRLCRDGADKAPLTRSTCWSGSCHLGKRDVRARPVHGVQPVEVQESARHGVGAEAAGGPQLHRLAARAKPAVGRPASPRFRVHHLAAEAAQHTKAGAR